MTETVRALQLLGDRKLELTAIPAPPPPAAGEVQIATKAVALNHLRKIAATAPASLS